MYMNQTKNIHTTRKSKIKNEVNTFYPFRN